VATRNNTGALNAALNAYTAELEAINVTMDCEALDDLTYLNAGDELQDQEDILANMTNTTEVPPAISDLYNRTPITAETIKNGRPFIWCGSNNTSTAYFIPPGQMKKLAQGGQFKTPVGLSKKGYSSPEPPRSTVPSYGPGTNSTTSSPTAPVMPLRRHRTSIT
jgi:hypothetical protein